MTKKVYGLGYSGRQQSEIVAAAECLGGVVFDIRWSARSRNIAFTGAHLRDALGDRYVRARVLGNRNYKGTMADVQIDDLETGIAKIEASDKPVILMCVCRSFKSCHRSIIAAELKARGFTYQELNVSDLLNPQPTQLTFSV
jgi:uncharacterized protein (DUF488 family)